MHVLRYYNENLGIDVPENTWTEVGRFQLPSITNAPRINYDDHVLVELALGIEIIQWGNRWMTKYYWNLGDANTSYGYFTDGFRGADNGSDRSVQTVYRWVEIPPVDTLEYATLFVDIYKPEDWAFNVQTVNAVITTFGGAMNG